MQRRSAEKLSEVGDGGVRPNFFFSVKRVTHNISTMERMKSLDPPHKGIRNLLSQFALLAGRTAYGNLDEVKELKTLGSEMFILLENHQYTEEAFILAPLKLKHPQATEEVETEHIELDRLEKSLQQKLVALDGSQSDNEGHAFYLEFTEFQSRYLQHIAEEDRQLEIDMQEAFTDEELIQHQVAIMESMDFATLLLWFKYIVPARRIEENAQVLTAFKGAALAEAYAAVLDTIRPQLSAERFEAILSKVQ
ncbi:MAG: hypothetical protein RL632_53 [Bacteroidota bacterium]